MDETILKHFFKFQNELKLYHWRTFSYARHKASDKLFENVITLTDTFIETFMGKYNKRVQMTNKPIQIRSFNDKNVFKMLNEFKKFLISIEKYLPQKPDKTISDLLNIRDELLVNINQTLYLFTLN